MKNNNRRNNTKSEKTKERGSARTRDSPVPAKGEEEHTLGVVDVQLLAVQVVHDQLHSLEPLEFFGDCISCHWHIPALVLQPVDKLKAVLALEISCMFLERLLAQHLLLVILTVSTRKHSLQVSNVVHHPNKLGNAVPHAACVGYLRKGADG